MVAQRKTGTCRIRLVTANNSFATCEGVVRLHPRRDRLSQNTNLFKSQTTTNQWKWTWEMNKFANAAVQVGSETETENGDKTFSTSLSGLVDLFFQVGAIRGQGAERAKTLFSPAYAEDPELATRVALWARDVRGGAGERQVFRDLLDYLATHDPARVERIVHLIPVVGRWDDLFVLLNHARFEKEVLAFYLAALEDGNGLAAKWAPREGSAKGAIAKKMMAAWDWTPKKYRKVISSLTKVVEQQMCAREWDAINYEHVPSVASARYGKAFGRHDQERYARYLEAVKKGEKKINTGAVYPYDVIKAQVPDATADTMWNKLPDYVADGFGFLPIIDVSGSMQSPAGGKGSVSCLDVAISLGLYLAEHNKSAFERLMMTFHTTPWICTIPKGTVREKVNFIKKSDNAMCGSTDLDKAMNLILEVAIKGNVPQSDMPTHLLILSDMEFNPGQIGATYNYKTGRYEGGKPKNSVVDRTKAAFNAAGYNLPNIVWWNIQSRHGHTPVRFNESGMALVSGFSPALMKSLLKQEMDPLKQVLATVNIERYNH